MGINAIGAIGSGDDKSSKAEYTNGSKRKPWEDIGGALNGFGSYMSNLPATFNSAFTVGAKNGSQTQGAFGA